MQAVGIDLPKSLSVLGLIRPFTEDELKHKYRELVFKTHPDKGGSQEKFIEVQKAYEVLLPLVEGKKETAQTTYEGDLLSNLGKGLGDLVNGARCDNCGGQGWKITIQHLAGHYTTACPNCGGLGTIIVPNSHFRDPLFSVIFSRVYRCTRCQGRGGFGFTDKDIEVKHTCTKCKGTGEVEVHNPVIPKNRVYTYTKANKPESKKQYCQCGAILRDGKCWRCE